MTTTPVPITGPGSDDRPVATIAQYREHYRFAPAGVIAADDEADLEHMARTDPYEARRAYYAQELARRRLLNRLGAEYIHLPTLSWEPDLGWLVDVRGDDPVRHLHVGGIELAAAVVYRRPGPVLDRARSLYVGPLPDWVAAKYEMAKRLLTQHHLLVVSREPSFFHRDAEAEAQAEARRLQALRSPLLIAVRPKAQARVPALLLAAWGLEYEHT